MDLIYTYLAIFVAYLIGSLSFAVIISRAMGLADPRSYGSRNPGATNVLRSGNKAAAVLTLLLDGLKGWAPVALVHWKSFELGLVDPTTADTVIALVGLAAFLGHLFPVFFRFQGGKGVATAVGVALAFEPLLGLAMLVTWCVFAAMFRYSSLASVVVAICAPFYMLLFFDRPSLALVVTVMSLLLIWRHWRNITNLVAGKEAKIGAKPAEAGPRHRRTRRLHAHGASSSGGHSHHSKGN